MPHTPLPAGRGEVTLSARGRWFVEYLVELVDQLRSDEIERAFTHLFKVHSC